jgi:hypothetical protein
MLLKGFITYWHRELGYTRSDSLDIVRKVDIPGWILSTSFCNSILCDIFLDVGMIFSSVPSSDDPAPSSP